MTSEDGIIAYAACLARNLVQMDHCRSQGCPGAGAAISQESQHPNGEQQACVPQDGRLSQCEQQAAENLPGQDYSETIGENGAQT